MMTSKRRKIIVTVASGLALLVLATLFEDSSKPPATQGKMMDETRLPAPLQAVQTQPHAPPADRKEDSPRVTEAELAAYSLEKAPKEEDLPYAAVEKFSDRSNELLDQYFHEDGATK